MYGTSQIGFRTMTIVERVLQQPRQQLVLLLPGPSFTGLNPRRGSVIWQGKLSDGVCIRNTLIDLVCTFNYSYYSCSIYLEISHNIKHDFLNSIGALF